MNTNKGKRELIPPWEMPSDPVKAVIWFLHWLLRVVVNFCWIPVVFMIIYEVYLNWNAGGGLGSAVTGGVITLLVGLGVWAILYVALLLIDLSTGIRRMISDVSRFERTMNTYRSSSRYNNPVEESKIVEGTITDLEEERRKRRRE